MTWIPCWKAWASSRRTQSSFNWIRGVPWASVTVSHSGPIRAIRTEERVRPSGMASVKSADS